MPDLYALLGVQQDVSPEELRKAYKRQALRCHPDRKGGDTDAFQNLQRAYAILNDPYQRKLYDTYGEGMLQLMEGNGGPDVVNAVFSRITTYQRAQLVLFFFLATSFFMLTPIFIMLRWDHVIDWLWVTCMIPLWVLHLLACIPIMLMPSPPEDMTDEEQAEWEEGLRSQRNMRANLAVICTLLIVLEVLVTLRLDGSIQWSWHAVLLPWALLEFWQILRKLMQPSPESVGWNLVRLAMAFTVAAKMNGTIHNWDVVFIPYMIGCALSCFFLGNMCCSDEIPTDGSPSPRRLAASSMCFLTLFIMWMGLLLWRLDDPDEISAFVVTLPFLVPPYLLCLCLSCWICCVGDADLEETSSENFEETSTEGLLNEP